MAIVLAGNPVNCIFFEMIGKNYSLREFPKGVRGQIESKHCLSEIPYNEDHLSFMCFDAFHRGRTYFTWIFPS